MNEPTAAVPKRPVGITVMALISLVQGALWLLLVVGVVSIGGVLGALAGPAGAVMTGTMLAVTSIRLCAAVLHIVFGVGALKLRKWAWVLGLVAPALSIAGTWLNIGAQDSALGPKLAGMALPVLMLMYLLTPGVRAHFRN